MYDGVITQKVREQFGLLTRKAASQFLNDKINERLKSAMSGVTYPTPAERVVAETQGETSETVEDLIQTTVEELEGFHIVKAIVRTTVDAKRIVHRDTQSYFGILLDDNNRKPITRLHFNRSQKYIGIFDKDKNETRHPIESLDDIYAFADQLRDTVGYYS